MVTNECRQTYTYEGYTASFTRLCFVFEKNEKDARKLMEAEHLPLEQAFQRAKMTKTDITSDILNDSYTIPEFTIPPENEPFMEQVTQYVSDFIVKHNIIDEDTQQILYLSAYSVLENFTNESEYKLSAKVNKCCFNTYDSIYRNKYKRQQLFSYFSDNNAELESYSIENTDILEDYISRTREQNVEKALETLTDREQKVVKMTFGFYGHPKSLEEIGQYFNVSRERIRQILAKSAHKLKNKSRAKYIAQYTPEGCLPKIYIKQYNTYLFHIGKEPKEVIRAIGTFFKLSEKNHLLFCEDKKTYFKIYRSYANWDFYVAVNTTYSEEDLRSDGINFRCAPIETPYLKPLSDAATELLCHNMLSVEQFKQYTDIFTRKS